MEKEKRKRKRNSYSVKMTNWCDLEVNQRIKKVYSQYSIKQFWDWWSNKEYKIMEVRIKDFDAIKEMGAMFDIPYSYSGVYVNNYYLLKNVIAYVRDRATIWFGINPRKKNWDKDGKFKTFGSGKRGGSSDENVFELGFVFVDIDRKGKKIGPATNDDLRRANIVADEILKKLGAYKWNENYCKICSGNGVQLLIKLDFPIKLPEVTFDGNNKIFIHNEKFEVIKNVIKHGIGKLILGFSKKLEIKDKLKISVDASCFNVNRVGALPFTKNYKFDGFTWRGIVEMKDGTNDGLTDYILEYMDDAKLFRGRGVFKMSSRSFLPGDKIRKGKVLEHPLVRFMLDNKLQHGHINNYLVFQLKCLMRDSKLDFDSKEVRKVQRLIEKKYKDTFPFNVPPSRHTFNKATVNNFCIVYLVPPIYPLWPGRNKKVTCFPEDMNWVDALNSSDEELVFDGEDVLNDIKLFKNTLKGKEGDIEDFSKFVRGLIKKYDEKTAKYFFDNIFNKSFNHE